MFLQSTRMQRTAPWDRQHRGIEETFTTWYVHLYVGAQIAKRIRKCGLQLSPSDSRASEKLRKVE